jgi:hypothetical protein
LAKKTITVSDLTGVEIGEEERIARLVVEEHPSFSDPVTLEVLPDEVEALLPEEQNLVRVAYYPSQVSGGVPRHLVMPLEEFNNLSAVRDMETVLAEAYRTQQEQEGRIRGRRGRRERAAGERRPRVDYASPEHAGEPHRGRVTEAEKDYVRRNLPEVNERLARDGYRTIDPSDPGMAERYGLAPVPHIEEEAEVVAEEVVEIEEGEEGAEEQPPRRVR